MSLSQIKELIQSSIEVKQQLLQDESMVKQIATVVDVVTTAFKNGNKVLFCGNGGSAADAQHLAAEFIVRLRPHINRQPIPALSLAQDTSTITACGNDYSFDDIFCRPFDALARKNDVLFIISTSGNSKNILIRKNYGLFKICQKSATK